MEAKAYLRNARISPRKVQIVLDLIRNKPVDVALATLDLTPKAASLLQRQDAQVLEAVKSQNRIWLP